MNQPYDVARYRFVTGAFNWTAIDLVLFALVGAPIFVATDATVADAIAHGAPVVGASLPVTSQSVAPDGTVQTNQMLIPDVPIGPDITWFLLAERNLATPNLSKLILFVDEAVELPFTPNGLDVVVQPDWLANRGWFRA